MLDIRYRLCCSWMSSVVYMCWLVGSIHMHIGLRFGLSLCCIPGTAALKQSALNIRPQRAQMLHTMLRACSTPYKEHIYKMAEYGV